MSLMELALLEAVVDWVLIWALIAIAWTATDR
jgi:hypothetical protein